MHWEADVALARNQSDVRKRIGRGQGEAGGSAAGPSLCVHSAIKSDTAPVTGGAALPGIPNPQQPALEHDEPAAGAGQLGFKRARPGRGATKYT